MNMDLYTFGCFWVRNQADFSTHYSKPLSLHFNVIHLAFFSICPKQHYKKRLRKISMQLLTTPTHWTK